MELTKSQVKALTIIRDFKNLNHDITAREFGKAMWPDSPRWDYRVSHGGMGTVVGAGMWLCAGGYLSKLKKKGLIKTGRITRQWVITQEAKALLEKT